MQWNDRVRVYIPSGYLCTAAPLINGRAPGGECAEAYSRRRRRNEHNSQKLEASRVEYIYMYIEDSIGVQTCERRYLAC